MVIYFVPYYVKMFVSQKIYEIRIADHFVSKYKLMLSLLVNWKKNTVLLNFTRVFLAFGILELFKVKLSS